MVRNINGSYKLPANPKYLTFTRSDGNSSLLPKNTTHSVDGDGVVNWMRPVPLEDASSQRWRHGVGQSVAKSLGHAGDCAEYVLQDWPTGYGFYDHHKGKGKGESSDIRHDLYLIGSTKANRFRSIPELVPHAIWLMGDGSQPCGCKYCSNSKSQKIITQTLSDKKLISPAFANARGSPSPSVRAKRAARSQSSPSGGHKKPRTEHRVYAAIRKPKKDVVPSETESPNTVPEPRQKVSDLRAILIRDDMGTKRWFREKELCWCQLSKEIQGPSGSGQDNICFWPGVIEEVILVAEPKSLISGPPINPPLPPDMATASGGESVIIENKSEPTWRVEQAYSYRVSLLATGFSMSVPEARLIPFQAHEVSPALKTVLDTMAMSPEHGFDRETSLNPNPDDPKPVPHFNDVAARYSKATVTAAELSNLWSLTDEWEFKYHNIISLTPPPPTYPNFSASAPLFPSGSSLANTNGFRPSPLGKQKSQTGEGFRLGELVVEEMFQGVWWGPERIWVDDLVRLKIDRSSMLHFPVFRDHLLPAAGPSRRVVDEHIQGHQLSDTPERRAAVTAYFGSQSRGVYLKITDIQLAAGDDPDRPQSKNCRVAGQLYEIVDHDWVDEHDQPDAPPPKTPPRPGNTSLTQPSPMAISPLPNPDPTLPISSTTAGVLAASQPIGSSSAAPTETNGRPSHNKLSTSASPAPVYDLPEAPEGYKFRKITKPGYELVISIALLSGRYYPRMEKHKIVHWLTTMFEDNHQVKRANFLYSLSGAAAGHYNSISPHRHVPEGRVGMLQKADEVAQAQLGAMKNLQFQQPAPGPIVGGAQDQPMDVDPQEPGPSQRFPPSHPQEPGPSQRYLPSHPQEPGPSQRIFPSQPQEPGPSQRFPTSHAQEPGPSQRFFPSTPGPRM